MRLKQMGRRMAGTLPLPGVVRDVWRFRAFILGSVRRDIEAQFRGSLLGAAWLFIQPLAMILVYTLIFSKVMGSRLAGVSSVYGYSVYLCAGLLTWNFFSESLARLQGVFVNNSNLLKKAAFPRICLPLIALGGATFNFLVIFGLYFLFLLISGNFPGWSVLGILPALAVQLLLTLGLGMLTATMNVFFRDVGQLVNMGLLFLFWLTPIVYPVTVLPEWARAWIWLNPLAVLTHHYQHIFLHGSLPDKPTWLALGAVAMVAMALRLLGWRVYKARAPEMADEL